VLLNQAVCNATTPRAEVAAMQKGLVGEMNILVMRWIAPSSTYARAFRISS
jgi:hypothetical protein